MLTITLFAVILVAFAAICGGCYLLTGDSFIGFVFGWQMLAAGFDLLGNVVGALFAAIADQN